ncbi:MAG: hypothetical protein EOO28_32310 [Comamonadaceae bacterium]|nr:MAG: hypothetical protein EOO28_32310 [Comamonadaceae bacterium]
MAQPPVTAPVDTSLGDPAAAALEAASPRTAAPQVAAALPPAPAMPPSAASAPSRPVPGPDGLAGFVPASQLSVKPVPISVGELEPAWLSQIKGAAIATVSVYVASDGSVFHVEVRQASDPRIAELARSAFAQARYRPGVMAGKNVASRVDISLDYQDSRDRVLDANAARPGSNVLKPHEIGPAFQPPPDNAPANPKVEK